MSNKKDSQNDDVGYGKPPESTRFQKGRSGNPKGRPRGTLNMATVLKRTLRERVVVNENGRRKTITKMEAAVKQLVNLAAGGDKAALRQIMALEASAEQRSNNAEIEGPALNDADQKVMAQMMQRIEQSRKGNEK